MHEVLLLILRDVPLKLVMFFAQGVPPPLSSFELGVLNEKLYESLLGKCWILWVEATNPLRWRVGSLQWEAGWVSSKEMLGSQLERQILTGKELELLNEELDDSFRRRSWILWVKRVKFSWDKGWNSSVGRWMNLLHRKCWILWVEETGLLRRSVGSPHTGNGFSELNC